MELLIPFALKSLLIAGVTLGLLHLLRSRSAAERSMVAHFGLLALLLLPIGSVVLPQLVVEAPIAAPVGSSDTPAVTPAPSSPATEAPAAAPANVAAPSFDPVSLWPLFYGFPAAVLLAVTLLAVLRLLALRAKATVLVEPSWLSAMAHAQRRMGFKHGTALLTSSELHSPISWGVLRPVILLNDEALEARHEAEAIIAHELAHVRGLDWAKLLMARAVTAIFWFNPLVWILAREAHQLREETADDAVLAANVESADYAQLLVGVARHDCKGLLLGAHGVAPGKGSLTRRVRRVLDASLPRTPVARGFAAGMAMGVIGAAAPLAAVTFAPAAASDTSKPYYVSAPQPERSLPSVVAQSVVGATALTGEVVSAHVNAALTGKPVPTDVLERRIEQQVETRLAYVHPHPPAPPAPPVPTADIERIRHAADAAADRAIESAMAAKALGVSPDYAARIRSAAPGLRIDDDDLLGMKAVGVTPEWLAAMSRAGYRPRDVGDLTGARAVGINPAYVAEMAAVGYRGIDLGDLTAMKALGVTGSYVRELRASGITGLSPEKLIELRAHGIKASALRRSPRPPAPPGHIGPEPPEPPEVDAPEPDPTDDQ
ncbi:M56 family metallopeptidase [Sphingomonas arenae]|uniref:M56 family metallopeptidase n=1 Tax=Sphingomonas arenae TaxID=2812555 RepID=UPI0019677A2B|nr:M56 family metallopeptidase [Sphingomonas arenae]